MWPAGPLGLTGLFGLIGLLKTYESTLLHSVLQRPSTPCSAIQRPSKPLVERFRVYLNLLKGIIFNTDFIFLQEHPNT